MQQNSGSINSHVRGPRSTKKHTHDGFLVCSLIESKIPPLRHDAPRPAKSLQVKQHATLASTFAPRGHSFRRYVRLFHIPGRDEWDCQSRTAEKRPGVVLSGAAVRTGSPRQVVFHLRKTCRQPSLGLKSAVSIFG